MRFFIPGVPDAEAEAQYERWARICRQEIPKSDRRVSKIAFEHDGDRWTAKVGETLRGERDRRRRRRSAPYAPPERLSDAATVLAIFSGNPYFVFTNAGRDTGVRSKWENPFMAGKPTSVQFFGQTD